MDKSTYLRVLRDESALLIDAIAASPDGSIKHCGDWTNRGLASHVGGLWAFVAANVLSGTGSMTRASEELAEPADGDRLVGWLLECREAVLDALSGAAPEAISWTFSARDHTAGFWQRRMAHETVVHRVDAQFGARGSADPIKPDVAVDGIDEFTVVSLQFSSSRPGRVYPAQSLHLHCTDSDGEWMLVGDGGPTVTVTSEHGKGDAAVRGRAEDILLWIWGRPTGDLDIFGDESVADSWRALAP